MNHIIVAVHNISLPSSIFLFTNSSNNHNEIPIVTKQGSKKRFERKDSYEPTHRSWKENSYYILVLAEPGFLTTNILYTFSFQCEPSSENQDKSVKHYNK